MSNAIINDLRDLEKPASMPGEEVTICYANFNESYEDCIMVNRSSAQRGLFAYTALCTYLLDVGENVPEVGGSVGRHDS